MKIKYLITSNTNLHLGLFGSNIRLASLLACFDFFGKNANILESLQLSGYVCHLVQSETQGKCTFIDVHAPALEPFNGITHSQKSF